MPGVHKDRTTDGGRWWEHADGLATSYPIDGQGGSTNTASSSDMDGESRTFLRAVYLEGGSTAGAGAKNVHLRNLADDGDLCIFHISTNANGKGEVQFPREGLEIEAAFGVRTEDAATDLVVEYAIKANP